MLGVLGINHKTASLNIRDQFTIQEADIIPLSESFLQIPEINGIVILSTCNRTEIYFSKEQWKPTERTKESILKKLHAFFRIEEDYTANFYDFTNAESIKHLFEVASGVDSMVIGEYQIVNQIKKAYVYCTEANLTDAILMRLFQKSFECSKKVRTETSIQQGATSIGNVAIDLSIKITKKIEDQNILIIGAGETGQLALKDFKKKGVKNISVTNRTDEKTLEIAKKYDVKPILFTNYLEHLGKFDIILTATNAGKYIIEKQHIEEIQSLRKGKNQLFLDLSVPRNIDIEIGNLNNCQLICVDDLQKILDDHKEIRENSVKKAHPIIEEMTEEAYTWVNSRTLRPIIKNITSNLQQLTQNELQEYQKNVDEKTFEQIEKYTGLLTQKYIRQFIKSLKDATHNGNNTASLDVVNQLFCFNDINED